MQTLSPERSKSPGPSRSSVTTHNWKVVAVVVGVSLLPVPRIYSYASRAKSIYTGDGVLHLVQLPPTSPSSPSNEAAGVAEAVRTLMKLERTPETPRSPGRAAFLSLLVPGVGQAYCGQYTEGALWLVVDLALVLAVGLNTNSAGPMIATHFGVGTISAVFAYQRGLELSWTVPETPRYAGKNIQLGLSLRF